MYTREKHSRSRKPHGETPSFSSTLLDEIYRSIDGDIPAKKHSIYRAPKPAGAVADRSRDFASVHKWVEKSKPPPNSDKFINDVIFFSSTSSSNSDSSGALSSTDSEFFGTEPKVSCFSTRPKPIKTGPPARKPAGDDDPIKAKSRALKLYANLKKAKQPISPGGRLTSFINSLFTNAAGKKEKIDGKNRFQSSSACSSTRSCLSKNSSEKRSESTRRTVRFNPVNEVVLPDLKYNLDKIDGFIEDDMSDASSDLFELDLFGRCHELDELPVYETTRIECNRVIASGLIR